MAGAGYKLFSTGDVLSASDVNTYLQQQTVMVFASAAARTSALTSVLSEGMLSYLKDTDAVEKYTGSAWTSVGGGGGKVLQVVSAVSTTQTTIASTTLTDTTVTATITPTLNTSKILVLISAEYFLNRSAAFIGGAAAVLRGATTIVNYPAETNPFINAGGASTISLGGNMAITYLDSPATTSATTYKLQSAVERTTNSASITYQYTSAPSTITLLEIGA